MSNLLKAYLAAQSIHKQINWYESSGRAQVNELGPLRVATYPQPIYSAIADARLELCRLLLALTDEERDALSKIEEIHTASGRLRGVLFGHPWSEEENLFIARQKEIYEKNWRHADSFTAFTIISFYYQPFDLPLQTNVMSFDWSKMQRYLHFAMRQPHIMQEEDEPRYTAYYEGLTGWLSELIECTDDHPQQPNILSLIEKTLTFGAGYYIDLPIGAILKGRAKVMNALTRRMPGFQQLHMIAKSTPSPKGRQKLRLGITSRNVADYTDTVALYSLFCAFDPDRYEIYMYSLDVPDASARYSADFLRRLANLTHKIVSLRGDGPRMAQQVLDDDLDILVSGTAMTFAVRELDQILSRRLARIQVVINTIIPASSGFDSFDYIIAPPLDEEGLANYRAESVEALKIIQDPMIWYERRPAVKPTDSVSRELLGIPEGAVLYCSGAAANKQMPATLRTWLNILRQVPNSYLLFYPFNPAWGGYFIGLTFLARLNALLKQYPDIDPKRIVVARQVTPEDGNRLIQLSDIYLGSFPHGGATSAMLALRHGKPVVARRTPWLRGTSDPSLLKSMGLEELIGYDNDEVTSIGARLGFDASYRHKISRYIIEHVETAPFFDIHTNSKRLQTVFDQIAIDHGLLPSSASTSENWRILA